MLHAFIQVFGAFWTHNESRLKIQKRIIRARMVISVQLGEVCPLDFISCSNQGAFSRKNYGVIIAKHSGQIWHKSPMVVYTKEEGYGWIISGFQSKTHRFPESRMPEAFRLVGETSGGLFKVGLD